MFNVHIYDFKEKKKYNTPLNDPFNEITTIGRFEVYNDVGELIFSSGKRRVRGLANYENTNGMHGGFLPLRLLRDKSGNQNLNVKNFLSMGKKSKLSHHAVVSIA